MHEHIEKGTLTRGADGALYLLNPGSCVRVDGHCNEEPESGTMDGKAANVGDSAILGDHMSARVVVNPDDQLSARVVVEPGDHGSARVVVNPGDQLSARVVVEPDDHDTARVVVSPGDQLSARMVVDSGEGLVN